MTDEAVNSPIRRSGCHELPTKSGSLLPAAPINAPWRTVSPHLAAWRSPGCKPERLSATAPCVPLRYALPGPVPREGFPKGRAAARPFVSFQGGAGGNRNNTVTAIRFPALTGRQSCRFLESGPLYPPLAALGPLSPTFLFRGAGGDILFSKENIPFGFRIPNRYVSAGNPG